MRPCPKSLVPATNGTLDLDSAEIGQIIALQSHEERMIKFWRLTKVLSSELLFWDGPRLL